MKSIVFAITMLMGGLNAHAISTYLGTDTQDVRSVNVATVTVQGPINANSTSVNVATVTVSNTVNVAVTASTTSIQAAGGKVITADVKGSTTALNVISVGQPDLHGLSAVYTSSSVMIVGSTLALTGKINEIDMRAKANDCTFVINSGVPVVVDKNTSNSKNFQYTLVNAQVLLSAKTAGATCSADITGAN